MTNMNELKKAYAKAKANKLTGEYEWIHKYFFGDGEGFWIDEKYRVRVGRKSVTLEMLNDWNDANLWIPVVILPASLFEEVQA